jgi:SAM-dependent methyltransferase
MTLRDADVIRREYASEDGLRARVSVYEGVRGPNALEEAFAAVRDAAPQRVLEAGCGWGEFAARVADELGVDVVAIDQSPRMVELARERGVDARVADVQEIPFADDEFDCAVANWMLYHVPDLDRALGELARVLRPGGRLVAATNGLDHLGELWALVGRNRAEEHPHFFAEDGGAALARHFARVERHDVRAPMTFASREDAQGYVAASIAHKHLAVRMPPFDGPLVATRVNAIFVAEK